jgi:hypothetical protein
MKILETITVIICYKTVAYRKHLRYTQISIKTNSHHELNNGVLKWYFKRGMNTRKVVFHTMIFHNWAGKFAKIKFLFHEFSGVINWTTDVKIRLSDKKLSLI